MKKQITRRHFLQSAGTAALAAPMLLPSRLWSADTKPSERINLGFIGMGRQNQGLLNGFLGRNETQVLAVCDVDTTRREHSQKVVNDRYAEQSGRGTYKGCAAYNDFRDLLAREEIDAVVIATPDHWHALTAIAAANAGKDIYCEKPLCQSIHEGRAMVNAVRKNKRIFQTGSQQRSSREFRNACELVRNGRLGKLEKIHVSIGGPGVWCDLPEHEPTEGLDWDLWLGPAPKRGWNEVLSPVGVHQHFPNWRRYREYGGGMVTDWGAHHFDIAQWALGMDESGPVEIIPAEDPKATRGVKMIYANGVEVIHTDGNGVTFFGSEGEINVNRGHFKATPESLAQEPLGENAIRLYRSNNHLSNWIECIRSRELPICDVEIGARTVTVCHLVNLAYYNHTRLKWNPAKEQFVGGAGDNKWLDVPYRDPWKLA